jgi:3-oxoacyl-[acyl-carrier-protein] synthase III
MTPGIIAVGSHVPERVITNGQIAEWTGKTAASIEARTGITTRRYAAPGTPTSLLAVAAVTDLTARRPDALKHLCAIIVATSTPDKPQPATAAFVARALKVPSNVMTFDVNAVCAGFLVALINAMGLVQQLGGTVLVVAADVYSGIMDRADVSTVSLFGDGGRCPGRLRHRRTGVRHAPGPRAPRARAGRWLVGAPVR